MQQLLQLLGRYRVILTFLGLQLICLWLIVQQNRYQSATIFTSANFVSAQVFSFRTYIAEYFGLREQNAALAAQNKRLQEELSRLTVNSARPAPLGSGALPGYEVVVGKVMNNSVMHSDNYLTIDRGLRDGVQPGMGVVGPDGVIGKVRTCNQYYSQVYSFLNSAITISAKVKHKNILGSVKWDKKDYRFGQLMFVPRDIKVDKGDTVLATGYSSIYPEDYPVGIVSEVSLQGSTSFLDIKIRLATQFSSLNYVYIIKNPIQRSLDSLQNNMAPERPNQ
jgi:rod shape-determining protein MreC